MIRSCAYPFVLVILSFLDKVVALFDLEFPFAKLVSAHDKAFVQQKSLIFFHISPKTYL